MASNKPNRRLTPAKEQNMAISCLSVAIKVLRRVSGERNGGKDV